MNNHSTILINHESSHNHYTILIHHPIKIIENTKKNINLILFLVKCIFKTHPKTKTTTLKHSNPQMMRIYKV
jgi:hypothetical protein